MGVPYKKLASLTAAAVIVGSVVLSQNAFAAGTATWTGVSNQGSSFSIGANWEGGTVPTTGDILILPCASEELTLTNDLSDVKFSGITMQKSDTNDCKAITIDKVDFTEDIILKRNGYSSPDKISSLSITSATGATNSISMGDRSTGERGPKLGSVTLTTKNLKLNSYDYILPSSDISQLSNIRPTESLEFVDADTQAMEKYKSFPGKRVISSSFALFAETYKGDLTFTEGAYITANLGSKWNDETKEYEVSGRENELAGKITLLGNVKYSVSQGASLKLTGSIDGKNFAIKAGNNSWGDFENATTSDNSNTIKGKQEFKAEEVDLKKLCKDSNTNHFTIGRNQTGTLADDSGCRSGEVTIDGLLKGVGTVEGLTVNGTLAPGNSPGTITATRYLNFGTNLSVFDVEILNKDTYDKVIVGKDFVAGYLENAVSITTGTTLKLSYLPDGQIKKGDQLMIIDNQSSTDVKGTFKDMPEGAEVIVSGAVFKISYKGGDGNDVVLTAQNDSVGPKAPNTGAESLVTNPAVASVAGVAAIGALAMMKRKSAHRR